MAVNPMTYRSNSDSLVYLYVKDQLYDDHCVESVENSTLTLSCSDIREHTIVLQFKDVKIADKRF